MLYSNIAAKLQRVENALTYKKRADHIRLVL